MSEETQFKLLCESLGLSVKKTATLLRIPHPTASNYASGHRIPPADIIDQMVRYFALVDSAASVFESNPDMLHKAALPGVLYKAAKRRMLERAAVKRNAQDSKQK